MLSQGLHNRIDVKRSRGQHETHASHLILLGIVANTCSCFIAKCGRNFNHADGRFPHFLSFEAAKAQGFLRLDVLSILVMRL